MVICWSAKKQDPEATIAPFNSPPLPEAVKSLG